MTNENTLLNILPRKKRKISFLWNYLFEWRGFFLVVRNQHNYGHYLVKGETSYRSMQWLFCHNKKRITNAWTAKWITASRESQIERLNTHNTSPFVRYSLRGEPGEERSGDLGLWEMESEMELKIGRVRPDVLSFSLQWFFCFSSIYQKTDPGMLKTELHSECELDVADTLADFQ